MKSYFNVMMFVVFSMIFGFAPFIPKSNAGELIPFPENKSSPPSRDNREPPYYNEFRAEIAGLNCNLLFSTREDLRKTLTQSDSENEFLYYQGLLNILLQEVSEKRCERRPEKK